MKMKETAAKEVKRPVSCGVYILGAEDGEVVYVGKSNKNIWSRIGAHSYKKEFTRVWVLELNTPEEADRKEAELIFKYRPRYNLKVELPSLAGYMCFAQIKTRVKKQRGLKGKLEGRQDRVRIGDISYWPEAVLKEYL